MSDISMTSNQPYLMRAMHEWICDNDCTPYLYINTETTGLRLPTHLLAESPLILNTSLNACRDFLIENHSISFQSRFSGEVFDVYLPIKSVMAIASRENGEGMHFDWESETLDDAQQTESPTEKKPKTNLKIIR